MTRQTKLIDIPIFTTALTAVEKADESCTFGFFKAWEKRGGSCMIFGFVFSGFSFFSYLFVLSSFQIIRCCMILFHQYVGHWDDYLASKGDTQFSEACKAHSGS